MLKLNLGCGVNMLPGWQNLDAEVDIGKPLPFDNASVDYILCEHCVEHIAYYEAIKFFMECRRILRGDGVARIIVPSLKQIWKCADQDYYEFTERWQKIGPTARGAMHAILYGHGHASAWTASLLEATLFYAGFDLVEHCPPHQSRHDELRDVDGHHRVIGERFNVIESVVMEGSS
jgi:SAM-dependent methyltransferase